MQLEKNIGQLLYCHDCVIVPEFGGFVANYRSGWIDETRQQIHPPSKEIGFNVNLKRNDGLLTDHVASEEELDYDRAAAMIAERVAAWKERLRAGERVDLEDLGGLYFDKDRKLHFDPATSHNFLTASFGMSRVQLPSLKLKEAEAEVPVMAPAVIIPIRKETLAPAAEVEYQQEEKAVVMWPSMAAALALLIAFGFWLNLRTGAIDKTMATLSSSGLFGTGPDPAYAEQTLDLQEVNEPDDIKWQQPQDLEYFAYSFVNHTEGEGRVVEWSKPKKAEPVSTKVDMPAPLKEERFHVVGGCFKEKTNAEGLINKLNAEGYDPKLVDVRRGLYRVSIGSYSTRRKALDVLKAIRQGEQPGAWLLVK